MGLPSCSLSELVAFEGEVLTGIVSREKLIKLDAKRREYNIIVIGEEQYLAYNRVGLTSFFQHRKVENLYLNHEDWVCHSLLHPDNAPSLWNLCGSAVCWQVRGIELSS